jgi:hypothetical protein
MHCLGSKFVSMVQVVASPLLVMGGLLWLKISSDFFFAVHVRAEDLRDGH